MHSRLRHIYLAGPMTGMPDYNYPAFRSTAAHLRARGHRVFNPADAAPEVFHGDVRAAFSAYTHYITCVACTLVLLPGWRESRGAMVEHGLASLCDLEIIELDEVLF